MDHLEAFFLRLVRENEPRLRRICRIYAPDPERGRDLYQDILVQVWRALPGFRGESNPATWLYRVALNSALAFRRDGRWRRESPLDDQSMQWPGHDPQPHDHAAREQVLERLYGAIDRLPDTDKALVLLHLDDVSYREIAEIMGLSESNVGVRLHRIRRRLGDWLAEDAA